MMREDLAGGTARSRRDRVFEFASQDGPEAVAGLLGCLAGDDRRTCGWALIALAERRPPPPSGDVVAALAPGAGPAEAPALATRRLLSASAAPATIVALGLTPIVAAALRSGEVRTRRRSAWLLGALGDLQAVPALIEALDDQDRRVQGLAAQSLGALGDARAVPALEALLRSRPGWRAQRRARCALDRLAG